MRIYKLLILSALLALLVACQENPPPVDVPDEREPSTEEKVSFRVASWSQEITEQTNLLVADEKPFFKNENIDVSFIPGAGGGDAIKNVLAGNADIAFTDAGSFFSALDQGEDLVAIYNIYPQNVFNVVALKENNITKPEDLKGKKVGVYSLASGTRQNLLILLHEAGLTEDDVEIVETGLLNFAPLMQKQVDATAATDTGLFLGKEKGLEDVDVIEVKDYLNFSSDLFVVTRDMFEEKEEELVRFLQAYKASAQWMMDDPDEAAALAVDYAIDGQDEAVNKEIIELRNAASKSDDPLGYIDVEQLQDAADTYKSLGLIEDEIDLEEHIMNILYE